MKKQPSYIYKITNFLDLVYVWNYGISFGFFKHYYQYSNYLFLALNSTITAYIWYLLLKCRNSLEFVGYSFIIGGAVGNIIDRIFRGAVFDFIYLHYKEYEFAVFNLADSFITFGALCIIYFYYQERQKQIAIDKEGAEYEELAKEAEKIRNFEK